MKTRKQEAPFTVKLELTEGCNLRCTFCGLQGIREKGEKNFKFMQPEWAGRIAREMAALGWKSRFECAMHGEPTMNPEAANIINAIRSELPRAHIMMTSNGGGLLGKPGPATRIQALFDAGLNVLALDDYKGANIVPRIRKALDEAGRPDGIDFFECPEDPRGNPYRRHKPDYKMVSFITDLQDTSGKGNGIRAHMNNGCGAAFPPNENMASKRCARPFRELSIRWNGEVGLCCNDWRGVYKCGNVLELGVNAVWQSIYMNAARKKLYRGQRDFGPCLGCDSHSFRTGLLPDPMGRAKLPKPNADDLAAIETAIAGGPYTKPVLRPWETKEG